MESLKLKSSSSLVQKFILPISESGFYGDLDFSDVSESLYTTASGSLNIKVYLQQIDSCNQLIAKFGAEAYIADLPVVKIGGYVLPFSTEHPIEMIALCEKKNQISADLLFDFLQYIEKPNPAYQNYIDQLKEDLERDAFIAIWHAIEKNERLHPKLNQQAIDWISNTIRQMLPVVYNKYNVRANLFNCIPPFISSAIEDELENISIFDIPEFKIVKKLISLVFPVNTVKTTLVLPINDCKTKYASF